MAQQQSLICPILTNANNAVPCIKDKCAFWDDLYLKCGYICTGDKINSLLEQMNNTLNDIRGRI